MTGLSAVKMVSYSRSVSPCGCSLMSCRRIRSTTLTTRTLSSGRYRRSRSAAASTSRVGVGETVVVLAPHVRGQQDVERGDRPTPRDLPGHLQPLGVLVEHRVDDVDAVSYTHLTLPTNREV